MDFLEKLDLTATLFLITRVSIIRLKDLKRTKINNSKICKLLVLFKMPENKFVVKRFTGAEFLQKFKDRFDGLFGEYWNYRPYTYYNFNAK